MMEGQSGALNKSWSRENVDHGKDENINELEHIDIYIFLRAGITISVVV